MKRLVACLASTAIFSIPPVQATPTVYPVTVESCNRLVTFQTAPRRAVSNDVNLTEMMVSLGLQNRMVGYSGITGWNKPTPQLLHELQGLPELASKYPTLETLLAAGTDFYFAGWNYGMRVGGDITPESLAALGIQTYELTESCAQIMLRARVTLADVYTDLYNLGRIFDVQDKALALVTGMKARIATVVRGTARKAPVRVFLYDSGEDRPMTAGRLAIPEALISTAGGRNVMSDVAASWTQVGWESVIASDPQFIIIVDYGEVSAAQKQRFLESDPALRSIDAVRHKRFVVLPYQAVTPGLGNVEAIERLATAFHGSTP